MCYAHTYASCFVSWSFFWIFLFSSLLPVVSSPPSPLDHNSVRTISISIACWLAAGDPPLMPVARVLFLSSITSQKSHLNGFDIHTIERDYGSYDPHCSCWMQLTVLQDLEGHLQMRHGNLEGH